MSNTQVFDFNRTKTVDGVEYVASVCPRCGGTGYMPFEHVDNGRCFDCHGSRSAVAWVTREHVDKTMARREKAAARRAKKAAEQAAAFKAEQEAWYVEHRVIVDAIRAYRGTSPMLLEFADVLAHDWTLTDGQLAAAERAITQDARAVVVPEGRQEIVGTIVSAKFVDGYGYNSPDVLKGVIDCGDFRVYGTIPAAIEDAVTGGVISGGDEPITARLKGVRVAMTATLSPSRDAGFGFYKRPTKARIAS